MEFLVERVFAGLLAVLCPLLTIFDLPGNSILLLSGLGFAFLIPFHIAVPTRTA